MIDLETLATTPDAAILTIGAIKFDPTTDWIDNDVFYTRVQCQDIDHRRVDPETVKWWSKQTAEAQAEVFEGDSLPLAEALAALDLWMENDPIVWSQGASFDIVILEDAYKQFGILPPWKYWDIRDTRTAYYCASARGFFEPFRPDNASAHVAWKDAYAQCRSVQRAMR